MESGTSRYDAELQMFIDTPREIDLARLQFLRWLSEQGLLEHESVGAPAGVFAHSQGEEVIASG